MFNAGDDLEKHAGPLTKSGLYARGKCMDASPRRGDRHRPYYTPLIIALACCVASEIRTTRVRTSSEATSEVVGKGRFEGGVEGQQVGLGGDALDCADDHHELLQVILQNSVLARLQVA